MDQITHKVMTRYVKVFRNGAHVGDIRYSARAAGWEYCRSSKHPGEPILPICPTYTRVLQILRMRS